MSNSRSIGQDIDLSTEAMGVLSLTASQEAKAEAVFGVVKFAREFLDLIDAADATAQADIAGQALKRLAAAGAVEGALQPNELRNLSLRLATHGEMTRLAVRFFNLISRSSDWSTCRTFTFSLSMASFIAVVTYEVIMWLQHDMHFCWPSDIIWYRFLLYHLRFSCKFVISVAILQRTTLTSSI